MGRVCSLGNGSDTDLHNISCSGILAFCTTFAPHTVVQGAKT
jgi:hypothetical protein